MLNKEVCKKCYVALDWYWADSEERDWNTESEVFCYACADGEFVRSFINIHDPPPENCGYAFEHGVAGAMNAEQNDL